MRQDIRNVLRLFIGLILEEFDPISSLYVRFHYLQVILVDGQLLQELPASLLVVADHQALQQQLRIRHRLHQHLSKLFRLFLLLDDVELFLRFFLRAFVLFSDLVDPCLVEHYVGDVLDGVSLKLVDDVAQELSRELLSKEVVKLSELFLLDLLLLGLGKRLDVSIEECDDDSLIILEFHLF